MGKQYSPCFNCADREPGCHGKCDRYREYEKQNTELRERGRAEHEFGLSSSPEFTRYLRNKKNIKPPKRRNGK